MAKTKKTKKTKKEKTVTETQSAENGNSVRVHYKGTLDDGTVFDSSHERNETLDFKIGSGDMISGFEEAIVGMNAGQTKSFRIESAYGKHNPEAIIDVPKAAFPEGFSFIVGNPVLGTAPTGQPIRATICEVKDQEVSLDHNHPLAGKDLNFEVELIEIQ